MAVADLSLALNVQSSGTAEIDKLVSALNKYVDKVCLSLDSLAVHKNALLAAEVIDPDVIEVVHECTVTPADIGVREANLILIQPPYRDHWGLQLPRPSIDRNSQDVLFSTREPRRQRRNEGRGENR